VLSPVRALALSAAIAVAIAGAAPPAEAGRPSMGNAMLRLEDAARQAFGDRYGCVLWPPATRRLHLLVTSPGDRRRARAIVRRTRARRLTTIGVVPRRFGEPAMIDVIDAILRRVGYFNPDVVVQGDAARSPTRCMTVTILLRTHARPWVRAVVAAESARFRDRVSVREVAPEELPPPEHRLEAARGS
jgi:hypothetical protein